MPRLFWGLTALVALVTLIGCGGPATLPTATAPEPTPDIQGTVEAAIQATMEALPTETPVPTPTPRPTVTRVPIATPTVGPTPTPAPLFSQGEVEGYVFSSIWGCHVREYSSLAHICRRSAIMGHI